MTSSLKSIFDFSRRRAIFVSAHKLGVYHWQKGDLASSYLFDVNEDGRSYFERYLRETPKIPTYILVDMFEEEFRRDTAPHTFGSDREALIERKKARLFRDTPYYYYKVQGRLAEGRRDDEILLSAITNPELITPWADLLEGYQIPLVGVYSIPLLTQSIIKVLPMTGENNLIVSIQSISGLRQTFISNNQLRVSRLIQLPRYGTEPYGPHISEEVDKIKRYLNSVRLISSDPTSDTLGMTVPDATRNTQTKSLQTYFLLGGDVLQQVREEYKGISTAGMHFVDVNELLSSTGSLREGSSPFCDQFFIYQLLKQKPKNTYAQPRQRRYNTMRKARITMLVCSALMIVGSLVWSGFTFTQGVGLKQGTLSAQSKSDFYNTRYQIARERLPQTPVEAADLKVAVELIENLMEYKSTPLEMIRIISVGMNSFSSIKLASFEWATSVEPNVKIATRSNPGQIGFSNISNTEIQYNYYHIAVINAEISPFDGNYRRAISLINEFAETLRTQPDVYDVSIISLPLDVSSESSMTGNTKSTQRQASFSVRVVLGVKHEV